MGLGAVSSAQGAPPLSVLIADDHPLFREALARLLVEGGGCRIVAQADNGLDAVNLTLELVPNIVVLDLGLPVLNGIEATRRIKAACPGITVIGLSVHDDPEHISAMLQAGALAYVTKDSPSADILRALSEATSGRIFASQSALRGLALASQAARGEPSATDRMRLTTRELQVVRLLVRGLSNREIADEVSLSVATVKGHLESLFAKLQVDGRTEAVAAALRLGLVDVNKP
ncbi:MAG: response regulator transcription factor [Dehalococcoidia bacterium]|jgi:DNA-binding NarL/FixJ family response regulator|nr:response regulator transcription factor [Dehalococcoidia bacterium]